MGRAREENDYAEEKKTTYGENNQKNLYLSYSLLKK